jgi:hypothetical protein
MSYKVPQTQRALVFQGGGALGAYAGVFKVLYEIVDLGSTFEALGIKEDTRVQVRKMAISASRSK